MIEIHTFDPDGKSLMKIVMNYDAGGNLIEGSGLKGKIGRAHV